MLSSWSTAFIESSLIWGLPLSACCKGLPVVVMCSALDPGQSRPASLSLSPRSKHHEWTWEMRELQQVNTCKFQAVIHFLYVEFSIKFKSTNYLSHTSSLQRMIGLYLSEKHHRSLGEASWPQVKSHEGWTAESKHSQGWISQMPNCLCWDGWKWTGVVMKRQNNNATFFKLKK